MLFILFLVGLFLIGCVLYGIYSGVSAIARGIGRISERSQRQSPLVDAATDPEWGSAGLRTEKSASPNSQKPMDSSSSAETRPKTPKESQDNVEQLKSLFELYQNGALSRDEFELFKQQLLFAKKEYPH